MSLFGRNGGYSQHSYAGEGNDGGWGGDWWWWIIIISFIFFGYWDWGKRVNPTGSRPLHSEADGNKMVLAVILLGFVGRS